MTEALIHPHTLDFRVLLDPVAASLTTPGRLLVAGEGWVMGGRIPEKNFFDKLNAIDSIPISLARWEMTGLDDEIKQITANE